MPVASFTVTKLRWLAQHEPEHAAARRRSACRTTGSPGGWPARTASTRCVTDRGDASGTGYWSAATGRTASTCSSSRFGRDARRAARCSARPTAGGSPAERARCSARAPATTPPPRSAWAPGPGDVVVSIGTSGTVFAVADSPAADPPGSSPASPTRPAASSRWSCTLNAARVLDAAAGMLGVDHERLAELALSAPAGRRRAGAGAVPGGRADPEPAAGRPARCTGCALRTATPAHLARAAVEGMLCGLADGLDALLAHGAGRTGCILVGGGAAVRGGPPDRAAVFGCPVLVPPPGEYVADGAARQAAWVLAGGAEPPEWTARRGAATRPTRSRDPEQYAAARDRCRPPRHERGPAGARPHGLWRYGSRNIKRACGSRGVAACGGHPPLVVWASDPGFGQPLTAPPVMPRTK